MFGNSHNMVYLEDLRLVGLKERTRDTAGSLPEMHDCTALFGLQAALKPKC